MLTDTALVYFSHGKSQVNQKSHSVLRTTVLWFPAKEGTTCVSRNFFLSLVPNWIGFINIQRQIMDDESGGVPENPRLIFMINSRIFPCEPVFPYLGDARKMRRLMRLGQELRRRNHIVRIPSFVFFDCLL